NYHYGDSPTAQPSPDVWYSFTAGTSVDVDLYACGMNIDTYIHLLDQYGNEIDYTGGPMQCNLMYQDLPPGSYYIVVEGSGNASVDYSLALYTYGEAAPVLAPGANMTNAIDAGILSQ